MEISNKFSENERINILAKLVEKEPITKAKLSADSFNLAWFFGQPWSCFEEHLTHAGNEAGGKAIHNLSFIELSTVYMIWYSYLNCSDDGQDYKPEPQEHIDLFIDDV